jgi:hypothetical protein
MARDAYHTHKRSAAVGWAVVVISITATTVALTATHFDSRAPVALVSLWIGAALGFVTIALLTVGGEGRS